MSPSLLGVGSAAGMQRLLSQTFKCGLGNINGNESAVWL